MSVTSPLRLRGVSHADGLAAAHRREGRRGAGVGRGGRPRKHGARDHPGGRRPPDRERLRLAAHLTDREAEILRALAEGMSNAEILQAYPDLEQADIREALALAAEALRERELPLLSGV